MIVELVSTADKRIVKMSAKAFGHALHVAHRHGWQPEQAAAEWPQEKWETLVILPHLGAYMPGIVSDEDTEGLHLALAEAISSQDEAADPMLIVALHTLAEVAAQGEFDVHFFAGKAVDEQPAHA